MGINNLLNLRIFLRANIIKPRNGIPKKRLIYRHSPEMVLRLDSNLQLIAEGREVAG